MELRIWYFSTLPRNTAAIGPSKITSFCVTPPDCFELLVLPLYVFLENIRLSNVVRRWDENVMEAFRKGAWAKDRDKFIDRLPGAWLDK